MLQALRVARLVGYLMVGFLLFRLFLEELSSANAKRSTEANRKKLFLQTVKDLKKQGHLGSASECKQLEVLYVYI